MVKPGVLLLLLAGAANFHLSQANLDIADCPINYFGHSYTSINVQIKDDKSAKACFVDVTDTEDCIHLGYVGNADFTNRNIQQKNVILSRLPAITQTSTCHVTIDFEFEGVSELSLVLYSAGHEAAIKVVSTDPLPGAPSPIALSVTSKGNTWVSKSVTAIDITNEVFIDISGCRFGGAGFEPGTPYDAKTCTTVHCDRSTGQISVSAECEANERCINGQCSKSVCTVTGSSIIDFHNNKHNVPDRCKYTLVKPSEGSSFELVAVFKERRRKDVSFLDHLIFTISGVKIYLEQGGSVKVDDDKITLSETAVEKSGVSLSKVNDDVILEDKSHNIKVSFNGYTAHVSGPTSNNFKGMCGNPSYSVYTTTLVEQETSDSDAKCSDSKTDNSEKPDCTSITDHCNLMKEPPFDSCATMIDSTPYIDACKATLCNYPAVDGHKCQFFEAYAKACELSVHTTVDWSSVEGCSAEPHPCHDKDCADDEFCGSKIDGTPRCFCRALFADKYPNTLGKTTVCSANAATLTLANCLLEDYGIDHTTLHLKDSQCSGVFDDETHMVTFHFDDSDNICGTEVEKDGSDVQYSNKITTQDFSNDVIVRHDQVTIDFSCHYKTPEVKDVTLKIVDGSVTKTYTSGEWSYSLDMNAYTDNKHKNLINADTELQLNQKIYVTLVATGLDSSKVVIVTQSCYAKSEQATENDSDYDLITERCKADETVTLEGNGEGTSNSFSFNMFQFTGKNGKINLHCEVQLCVLAEGNCLPDCNSEDKRKRRSFRSKYDRNLALITMSWDN